MKKEAFIIAQFSTLYETFHFVRLTSQYYLYVLFKNIFQRKYIPLLLLPLAPLGRQALFVISFLKCVVSRDY